MRSFGVGWGTLHNTVPAQSYVYGCTLTLMTFPVLVIGQSSPSQTFPPPPTPPPMASGSGVCLGMAKLERDGRLLLRMCG